MRLGLMAGYSGAKIQLPIHLIKEADRLGYYAVWTAEAYGSDAVTPLAWIGAQTQQIRLGTAIMQMSARTPAMTAMTAMTLDQLSGGRMLLGLGLSGPQVVEGWHGQPFDKPLARTREYVSILRRIFTRTEPLVHDGLHYQIPYKGADATGLGKPLKSILHGRADLPIYLAAIGPQNVTLAAEIGDGWLPIFFSPTHYDRLYRDNVEAGFARAGGKSLANFDIAPTVSVVVGDDVAACRNVLKPMLALYVGGMGAKGKNFYHDLVTRYGYGDAADAIQDLYLAGRKEEAIAAVPNELIDEIALCGPKERIRDRLRGWQSSPVTTMNVTAFGEDAVRVMAELVLDAKPKRHTIAAPEAQLSTPSQPLINEEQTMTLDDIFADIARRIEADPELVAKINSVYQVRISDAPDQSRVVDLRNGSGSVTLGTTDSADCTVVINSADFIALSTGELNPQVAFMQGKLEINGDIMLATKLQQIMG